MPKTKHKAPYPGKISPMLATLVKEPSADPQWVYEVKFDGYRIMAYVRNGQVTLYSRGGQDYTSKYKAVADELAGLKDCVLDGEVVVLDDNGYPDFSALQNYQGSGDIAYYIFDLLYFDGVNYMNHTLLQRKELLLNAITKENILTYSDHFPDGLALFEKMKEFGLEGIIAKRKDSTYQPGVRTKDWLKVKIKDRREFVIGGWSESENTKSFRSILFGEYRDDKLVFVHHSGGGYTAKQKAELFTKFKELEVNKCPFVNGSDIDIDTTCHWVKPELIGEFEISNMTTKKGLIRHPAIFKSEKQVEKPKTAIPDITSTLLQQIQKVRQKNLASQPGSWEVLDKHIITSEEIFKVEGKTITLTNIERHVWPDVTKADLIQYYIGISEWILPYLEDRPVGINICLQNPAEGFFIRGMEGRQPKWATVFKTDRKHKKAGKSDEIEWLVCNDLATLVWIINLNSIDLHPWGSRSASPNQPDYISIDLDPSDDDFSKVIQTALASKKLFDQFKLKSFVKTSGKTGMHIYLPCAGIEYGQSRTIAENICEAIHKSLPLITTTSTSVNSRGNLLYIDPSQNDYADRLAAPYCVRSYNRPTVSTPLDWKEVTAGLDPAIFNIHTMGDRLVKKGDLWAGLFDKKVAAQNSKILKQFLRVRI